MSPTITAQCDGTGLDTVATEDGPEAVACTGCPGCQPRRFAALAASLAASYEDEGAL